MPLELRMENKGEGGLEYGRQVSGQTQEEIYGPLEDLQSDQSELRELTRAIRVDFATPNPSYVSCSDNSKPQLYLAWKLEEERRKQEYIADVN